MALKTVLFVLDTVDLANEIIDLVNYNHSVTVNDHGALIDASYLESLSTKLRSNKIDATVQEIIDALQLLLIFGRLSFSRFVVAEGGQEQIMPMFILNLEKIEGAK